MTTLEIPGFKPAKRGEMNVLWSGVMPSLKTLGVPLITSTPRAIGIVIKLLRINELDQRREISTARNENCLVQEWTEVRASSRRELCAPFWMVEFARGLA
jgi:hypothetical protein